MNGLWLIIGLVIGVLLTYSIIRTQARTNYEAIRTEIAEIYAAKTEAHLAEQKAHLMQRYEARILALKSRHTETIALTRRDSTNQSRAVLKGKMAEQIAPLLPGFNYWPADARFLGDPVDYIIFDGYSTCKDGANDGDDLEVVLVDIKKGARTTLNRGQRQIARAIEAGRIRFEIVRVFDDGTIRAHSWKGNKRQET